MIMWFSANCFFQSKFLCTVVGRRKSKHQKPEMSQI